MNVIIPMAGDGRRFAEAGFTEPKPLIPICGRPMIDRVIESLSSGPSDKFFLVARSVPRIVNHGTLWSRSSGVGRVFAIYLDEPTRGAADTLLRARRMTRLTPGAVVVANCDQLITTSIAPFLRAVRDYDAGIVVFNSTNPHHSFVTVDDFDFVTSIAEKRVISDLAVLGIYWFKDSDLLFEIAEQVIADDERVNGEFYISSILARMVSYGLRVKTWEIDVHEKHILGTPEELRIFLDKVDAGKVRL